MILPRHLRTAPGREQVGRALYTFNGYVILDPQRPAPYPAGSRLSHDQRAAIVRALAGPTDPQRHLWIASGRDEVPSSLLSLVHARMDSRRARARVDLVLSCTEYPAAEQDRGYVGFGEFTLLTAVLVRRSICHLAVPLVLDARRTGLASAGWSEAAPGHWTWRRTEHD